MTASYRTALIQLRLLADENNDDRSLVAIAAAFERDFPLWAEQVAAKSHNRNANP